VSAGPVTLTFASANPGPVDNTFAAQLTKDSGGQIKLRQVAYNYDASDVDEQIAADLQSGKLALGDVGSRAWETIGAGGFEAYQEPYLVTSRELLDKAVTGSVASLLLGGLKAVGITGLAIVPASIRYLYSTRPLSTPAQFHHAKIKINTSPTTTEIMIAFGATGVTGLPAGASTVQALRDGKLTAVESDPATAAVNGYVSVAPYVLVNAPLFAKTTTFAGSSALLNKLTTQQLGWLREAAQAAAATQATTAADRTAWATDCAQGLKPQAVTQTQFNALSAMQAPTYAALADQVGLKDPPQETTLAVDLIGGLATQTPRTDSWATCHGLGVMPSSPTKVLDGTYGVTVTVAALLQAGDPCPYCGNAGTYRLTIEDGRYALFHPKATATQSEPRQLAQWDNYFPASDPIEIGSVYINGDRATIIPQVNQNNGSAPSHYTFELFRDQLTWHLLSGNGWGTNAPWRKLS
jgi:TRAP-type C4-dicarboxylate transport system substrate-binding protein